MQIMCGVCTLHKNLQLRWQNNMSWLAIFETILLHRGWTSLYEMLGHNFCANLFTLFYWESGVQLVIILLASRIFFILEEQKVEKNMSGHWPAFCATKQCNNRFQQLQVKCMDCNLKH